MRPATSPRRPWIAVGAAAVVLTLALAAGAGGATAAAKITGKDVKDSSLTGKDVKDSSLTGKDVKDGSLSEADVQPGSLSGVSVRDGSITAQDLAAGTVAVPGLRGLQRVSTQQAVTPTDDFYGSTFATVACPSGKVAVSGGYDLPSSATDIAIFRSRPTTDLTGWEVAVRSSSGSPFVATFYALCATP